ncbi:MAG: high-affinity nickel-transport family protein [candidate division NC10 bacterium]
MDAGLSVILLGLLLGVQHATDPDHVVAVATIVSRTRRFGAGAVIGALWGVGHTATIAAVGTAIIVFKVAITPAVGLSLEFAVAVMLMALGAVRLVSALRESDAVPLAHLGEPHPHAGEPAFHSHPHTHGDTVHRHPHLHPSPALARALQTVGAAQALRSVGVGLVHGLAGSAAVALLVLSTVESAAGAAAYLVLFGAGTIVGMTAITAVLALPFAVSGRWLAGGRRGLAVGTGLLSLGLGLYLAFQIGFVDGLFLGAPVWLPR